MRTHAQCTLIAADATGATAAIGTPGWRFLNVAAAAPSGTPSVANYNFRADAATGLIPEASSNTAGVVTGVASREAAGRWLLGLQRAVDRTRSHVAATFSNDGTNSTNPQSNPRASSTGGAALTQFRPILRALACIAGATGTTLAAAAADFNVVLQLVCGGTTGPNALTDMSTTSGGGFVHVLVFADDDISL